MATQPKGDLTLEDLEFYFLRAESEFLICSTQQAQYIQLVLGSPQSNSGLNSYDEQHFSNKTLGAIGRYRELHRAYQLLTPKHKQTLEAYFTEKQYPLPVILAFNKSDDRSNLKGLSGLGILMLCPSAQSSIPVRYLTWDPRNRLMLSNVRHEPVHPMKYIQSAILRNDHKTVRKIQREAEKLLKEALEAFKAIRAQQPATKNNAFKFNL